MKTAGTLKTGLFALSMGMLLIGCTFGAVGQSYTVDYETTDDIDSDGDGIPDRYDEYPYDRDNDGIPDDRDEYPDDPYNRDTTGDYDREDTATGGTATDTDGGSSGGDSDELCCMVSLWWLWVIAGCLALFCDYRGIFTIYRKGVLGFIGGCMIVYGFWLGGFL